MPKKNIGHGEKFSRQQEAAIIGLMSKPTITAAARAGGVSVATLRRWLADPEFAAAYRVARRDAMHQATARLQRAATAAVTALESIVRAPKSGEAARVSAARTILELGLRAVESDELLARLEHLEALERQRAPL